MNVISMESKHFSSAMVLWLQLPDHVGGQIKRLCHDYSLIFNSLTLISSDFPSFGL